MTSADSNFWFYAGCLYGLASVMVLLGVIYLTPAGRYLPRIDAADGVASVVYTGLILFIAGAFGLGLKDVLPGIYV